MLSRVVASSTQTMDQSPSKTSSKDPTIVEVDLGNRSYPIYIGAGLLDEPGLLQRYLTFTSFKFSPCPSFWFIIMAIIFGTIVLEVWRLLIRLFHSVH